MRIEHSIGFYDRSVMIARRGLVRRVSLDVPYCLADSLPRSRVVWVLFDSITQLILEFGSAQVCGLLQRIVHYNQQRVAAFADGDSVVVSSASASAPRSIFDRGGHGAVVALLHTDVLEHAEPHDTPVPSLHGYQVLEGVRYVANTVVQVSLASGALLSAITVMLSGSESKSTSSASASSDTSASESGEVHLTAETLENHRILSILHKRRSGNVKRAVRASATASRILLVGAID